MPWEFWNQLLLLIDGWTLKKKISIDDASLLQKVWKRDRRISDTYIACKKQSEKEAIFFTSWAFIICNKVLIFNAKLQFVYLSLSYVSFIFYL